MFYKSTILFAVIVSVLGGLAETSSAISPESFACSRSIALEHEKEALQKSTLVAVPLADDMFQWLQPDFVDLRVFDDHQGQVASMVVEVDRWGPVEKTYSIPSDAVKMEFDEKLGQTIITLDTKLFPISKVKVHSPNRNFRREVEVWVSRPDSLRHPWKLVKSDRIERIDLEGIEKEELAVSFSTERAPKMQVKILHGENSPLKIERVQLIGPAYECRFIAEPGRRYTLAYGSESVGASELDVAALNAAQQRSLKPIKARLSKKVVQRKSIESADSKPKLSLNEMLVNPWLLYPAVILLVVLLGCGLVQAAKRMPGSEEKNESDEGSG